MSSSFRVACSGVIPDVEGYSGVNVPHWFSKSLDLGSLDFLLKLVAGHFLFCGTINVWVCLFLFCHSFYLWEIFLQAVMPCYVAKIWNLADLDLRLQPPLHQVFLKLPHQSPYLCSLLLLYIPIYPHLKSCKLFDCCFIENSWLSPSKSIKYRWKNLSVIHILFLFCLHRDRSYIFLCCIGVFD